MLAKRLTSRIENTLRPAESLGTSGYFLVWNRHRNRSVLMPRALATSSLRYCFFSGIPNSFSRLGRNALNGQSGSAVTSMESRNCASAAVRMHNLTYLKKLKSSYQSHIEGDP